MEDMEVDSPVKSKHIEDNSISNGSSEELAWDQGPLMLGKGSTRMWLLRQWFRDNRYAYPGPHEPQKKDDGSGDEERESLSKGDLRATEYWREEFGYVEEDIPSISIE
ncbi:hypothetical protein E1B28_009894 [Marasmius oreades]|uniref:Uncharacterized protein n=1 Tax=Marasmius oreades TaxID=181124 RepID=A0A9P7RW82_9AGAR|nr:uncharacterized protein E1B28_009894 [Marasmius oreades]KAG7090810.1 hypothetical protein E1B28_009894 [Marasmius oreades]